MEMEKVSFDFILMKVRRLGDGVMDVYFMANRKFRFFSLLFAVTICGF